MTSEFTHGTLSFMKIYLFKVNGVHLSSAKLICQNSCVLVLSFDFEFEKTLLGLFFIDRMCHEIDSPILTQKV